MSEPQSSFAINPGRGLGWITLGASVHAILTRLKSQPSVYTQLDLIYSSEEPTHTPLVLSLPANGMRLRFDGPDQRLRLVEIVDFSRSTFTFKSQDLVRRTAAGDMPESLVGPSFKHLYNRLFGPSYPGEYLPPTAGDSHGIYVLSWPGLAAKFKIRHDLWSEKADFVSQLSTVASPALSLAIFSGSSWPEARASLYTKRPQLPRSLALASKINDTTPDEVEEVVVYPGSHLQLFRRTLPPFTIYLNETTPQELVSELGPPDAIYRKSPTGLSVNATSAMPYVDSMSHDTNPEASIIDHVDYSTKSHTDEAEMDAVHNMENTGANSHSQMFYNYFHHGFDLLISSDQPARNGGSAQFVTVKAFLHGNIPGSYSFNRHRKSRWKVTLDHGPHSLMLNSEMKFHEVSTVLQNVPQSQLRLHSDTAHIQQAMVLNRGWGLGHSPESSIELLNIADDQSRAGLTTTAMDESDGLPTRAIPGNLADVSNTELFGYPGLLFEVLKNGTICCLTVYGK